MRVDVEDFLRLEAIQLMRLVPGRRCLLALIEDEVELVLKVALAVEGLVGLDTLVALALLRG